jgi:hypothetical protein
MTYLVKQHDVKQVQRRTTPEIANENPGTTVDEIETIDERDCAETRSSRAVEFEWHVVYSTTFQVPVLYFNVNDLGSEDRLVAVRVTDL